VKVSFRRLRNKLKNHHVRHRFQDGWDSKAIDPFNGGSDFLGVLLHHTAGTNSANFIVNGPYKPVRLCQFLVNRDGSVTVMSGSGAYHAGKGGPWRFPGGVVIPKDQGNRFLYGIEIESLGRVGAIGDRPEQINAAQVVETAKLTAALLNAMAVGPRMLPVSRVIRHRDWAYGRKVDVLQDLAWWHQVIGIARRNHRNPTKVESDIRAFIHKNPSGKYKA
jgi:N-acetyl-anhydromuramyl-L-alanine amidase AmpD